MFGRDFRTVVLASRFCRDTLFSILDFFFLLFNILFSEGGGEKGVYCL